MRLPKLSVASLTAAFTPEGKMDAILRLVVAVLLLAWNVVEGAVFENEYADAFLDYYPIPIWRALLLTGLIAGALWCPSVGIMLAFAAFFYVMDMELTLDTWSK